VSEKIPDQLNQAIVDHTNYLWSDECLDAAWDEARDRMPDHLTGPILEWFQSTYRFSTTMADWLEKNAATPSSQDDDHDR